MLCYGYLVLQTCLQVECHLVGADPIMRQTIFECGFEECEQNYEVEAQQYLNVMDSDQVATKLSSTFRDLPPLITHCNNRRHTTFVSSTPSYPNIGSTHRNSVPHLSHFVTEKSDHDPKMLTNGYHRSYLPAPPPPLLSELAQLPLPSASHSQFKTVLAEMLGKGEQHTHCCMRVSSVVVKGVIVVWDVLW